MSSLLPRLGRWGLAIVMATLAAAPGLAQVPVRVSLDETGAEADSPSGSPALSDDGRFVAFHSFAQLVPADTDSLADIYLVDRDPDENGTFDEGNASITLVSPGPSPLATHNAFSPVLSDDGSTLAFASSAPLLPGIGSAHDVFVWNVAGSTLDVVSMGWDGQASDGASRSPALSSDGTVVAFQSGADNLVQGLPGFFLDRIFVRAGGVTTCVSLTPSGNSPNSSCESPSLSADGRQVAFVSGATTLGPTDTNGFRDIYVHDRVSGETTLVSLATGGAQANGHCFEPSLSADGRWVTFASEASNLAPEAAGPRDVYLHDRDPDENGVFDEGNGVTSRVTPGDLQYVGNCRRPTISPDGRFVAYATNADLLPTDWNGAYDVFVLDRDPDENGVFDEGNERTIGASRSFFGGFISGASGLDGLALATTGGLQIAYAHDSPYLIEGDGNEVSDVFLTDMRHWLDVGGSMYHSGLYVPHAFGTGELLAGSAVELSVLDNLSGSFANLVIGLARLELPFKGGVLIPSPDLLLTGFPTPAARGDLMTITGTWPAGLPSGLSLWLQWWTHDPGLPSLLAPSNGIRITTP